MKRLLIYDADEGGVGFWWKVGAKLFAFRYDTIVGCKNWKDCLTQLKMLEVAGAYYDSIQIWSHGLPADVFIDGKNEPDAFWQQLARLVAPTSTVWLRVCAFFAGQKGKTEANRVAEILKCRLLAHTHIIGNWACQSGLHAVVAPNKLAQWPDDEGILPESERKPGKHIFKTSAPWLPNTVLASRVSEPEWPSNK